MDLYFSPLACSLAARIALYELGADARYVQVDPKTKRLPDANDYREVHPLGLVPVLRTDAGEVLTENAAILQYLSTGHLAPPDASARTQLQAWLCFIGTELHKGLFAPLLDAKAPEAAKAYALEKGASRLAYVERHLAGRELLLDAFSVADAYLFAVLNWTAVTPIDMAQYPALRSYHGRLRERPSCARAFQEERALYAEELARARA